MADRYWVGGSGAWNTSNTTNWSATSGGAGGASAPTLADNVFIDTLSGTGTITGSSGVCNNLTVTASQAIGFSGGTLFTYGSLVFPSGGSFTCGSNITFAATTTGKTVTSNGKQSTGAYSFSGIGGEWTLQDTLSTTNQLGLTNGTFNSNNQTINCNAAFNAGGGTSMVVNLGSSTVNTPSAANPVNITNTGLTFNAGTSTINAGGGVSSFNGGGVTFYNVNFPSTAAGAFTFSGANTFNNLTFAAATSGTKTVNFAASQVINGTLTTTSASAANRVKYASSVAGTQRQIYAGAVSIPNSDFQDIFATEPFTAPLGCSSISNNTNITFDTQILYWIGSTGSWTDGTKWSLTSGGAAANVVPGSTNSVIFDANSNTGTTAFTVTVNGTAYCNDFSTGGAGGALDGVMTFAGSSALNIYGSLTTPAANFTRTFTGNITFAATSTGKTITSNGVTWTSNLTFNGIGGGWTLQDAFTAGIFSLDNGSFVTNNQTLTIAYILSNNSNIRSLTLGSSIVNCTYAGINFTNSTNLTFNAGTSQISTSSASGVTEGIFASGLTFYNVSMADTVTYSATISGSNTFNNLDFVSKLGTSEFTLGANQIVNGTFSTSNNTDPTYRSRIKSTTQGTQRTIKVAACSLTNADFQDIVIDPTSGTYPLTGTSLGNAGNNSGITFTAPKTVYWNLAGTQNWYAAAWATTNSGTPSVNNYPIAQDTAVFTEAGAAGTINLLNRLIFPNITFADGVSNRVSPVTLRFNQGGARYYFNGNFTGCSSLSITDIGGNGIYFQNVGTQTFTSNGSTISISSSNVYSTFGCNFTLGDSFTLGCPLLVQSGGTLTLNGKTLTLPSINLTGAATVAFGSSGVINLTGNSLTIWTGSTTQVITGTSVVNCTYSGATGTRTINASTPTEANTVNFNVTAGTDQINPQLFIRDLNLTGFAGTFVNSARTLYGNWTNPASGITFTAGTSSLTFAATSGTQTITTNGVTLDFPITKTGAGTLQLGSALTLGTTRTFTVSSGTFNTANYDISSGVYTILASATVNLGSSVVTATGTGTTWNNAATTTFNAGTSEIVLSNNTTTARTFAGGGAAYNKVTVGGNTSISTTTFSGNNYFAELASTKTVAHTLTFTGVNSFSFGLWSITGTVGNVVTITSTNTTPVVFNAKSTATLNYLAITYNTGTPGAVWIAGANSTLGTGVTGWALAAGTPRTLYWGPTAGTSTGTWDASTVTNWYTNFARTTQALTAPTGIDNVVFDSASDNGTTFTVTAATTAVCQDLTVSGLDNTMTLAGALNVRGNLSLSPTNFNRTFTSITFTATSTGKTITLNGVSLAAVNFNGIGGEWTLQDALTCAAINVIAGSFVTNNQTISGGAFVSTTFVNPRAFTLGSSTISLNNSSCIDFTNYANLTFNAGTSQINVTSAAPFFSGGSQTFYNVTMGGQASQSDLQMTQDATFNNLTILPSTTSNVASPFNLYTSGVVVNGTLTATGSSPTQRIIIKSNTTATQRTIKVAACSLTDVDFRDIVVDPTSATYPLTGTRLGNQLNNSGITFSTPKTVYWNLAGTQNWTANGWATTNNGTPNVNNFPLPQDTATFTEAGAAGTVTINGGVAVGTIQMADGVSNRTTPFTLAVGLSFYVYGDVTLFSGLTVSSLSHNWYFAANNYVQNFKTNGAVVAVNQIQIGVYNTSAGTFKLLDNFTQGGSGTGGGINLNAGTLNLNSYVLNAWNFVSNSTNVRSILFGTGSLNTNQLTGNAYTLNSTNLTYTGTPTVNINNGSGNIFVSASNGTQTNTFDYNFITGTGIVQLTGVGFKNVNFTGFAGTVTDGSFSVFGSLTLSTGMTYANNNVLTFASTTTGNTITSNGKQLVGNVTFNGIGGGWSLVDDFYLVGSGNTGAGAINGLLTFSAGTFTANNKNVTAFNVTISSASVRNITMGTGTWTLNGTNNIWDVPNKTNLTFNSTGSTIAVTSPKYLKKTFYGNGLTYGTLNIDTTSGYVDLTLDGSNTFSTISSTGSNKYLLTLSDGATTTATNFSLNDAGAIRSAGIGSSAINVAGNGAVSTTGVKYYNIDIGSTGTWTANSSVLFNTGNITAGTNTAYGVLLTSGTTWTVPANWNASLPNFVYMFGGGGGGSSYALSGSTVVGGAGGGGGGFTLVQNYSTTAGSSVTYSIGAAGTAGTAGGTLSTGGTGGNTTFASGTYSAGGGSGGVANATVPSSVGGSGGTGTTYNGGTGGNGATNLLNQIAGPGGGAGAGGLLGIGGSGGTTTTSNSYIGGSGGGNGGGSNGQGNVNNPSGGNNIYGFGGGISATGATSGAFAPVVFVNSGVAGGGSTNTINGYAGIGGNGIDVYDIFGSGGGSAGWTNNSVPLSYGGLFGGGGGGRVYIPGGSVTVGQRGGQGGIVIVYNIPAVTNNNNYMIMF